MNATLRTIQNVICANTRRMLIASSDQNQVVPSLLVHNQIASQFNCVYRRRRLIVKAARGTVVPGKVRFILSKPTDWKFRWVCCGFGSGSGQEGSPEAAAHRTSDLVPDPRATSDSAAGNGVRRGVTAGRWVASPLRTTGCLKSESLPDCEPPPLGVLKSASGLCSLAHACIVEFHSLDSDSAAIC